MKPLRLSSPNPSERYSQRIETKQCVLELSRNTCVSLIGPTRRPTFVIPLKEAEVSLFLTDQPVQRVKLLPFALLALMGNAERLTHPDDSEVLFIEIISPDDATNLSASPEPLLICRHPDILGSVQMIRRHLMNNETVCPAYINACVALLVLQVEASRDTLSNASGGRFNDRQWELLSGLIDERLDQTIRVSELATAIGYSPSQCSKAFKATVGYPPQEYIRQVRIDRARELLQTTDLSLADIAFMAGFCSQAHMTATFSRVLGATPGHIRQTSSTETGQQENDIRSPSKNAFRTDKNEAS